MREPMRRTTPAEQCRVDRGGELDRPPGIGGDRVANAGQLRLVQRHRRGDLGGLLAAMRSELALELDDHRRQGGEPPLLGEHAQEVAHDVAQAEPLGEGTHSLPLPITAEDRAAIMRAKSELSVKARLNVPRSPSTCSSAWRWAASSNRAVA